MPKRNLHIVNPNNPLFAICERCHARFSSFAYNAEEADRQVRMAFDDHKCHSSESGPDDQGPKAWAGDS